jgi:hypothetical protein
MTTARKAHEALTAEQLFTTLYNEADSAADAVDTLRTRGTHPSTGAVTVPRSNLVLTHGGFQHHLGAHDATGTDHISKVDGLHRVPILSVTRLLSGSGQEAIPASVGAYRGDENFPDFFIRHHQPSTKIICTIGRTGVRGDNASEDALYGETSVWPDAVIGGLAEEDQLRLSAVAEVIRERINGITAVTEALLRPRVSQALYTGGEPQVTHFVPV